MLFQIFLLWNSKDDILCLYNEKLFVYQPSSNYLILCSTQEIKSYRFGTTWERCFLVMKESTQNLIELDCSTLLFIKLNICSNPIRKRSALELYKTEWQSFHTIQGHFRSTQTAGSIWESRETISKMSGNYCDTVQTLVAGSRISF